MRNEAKTEIFSFNVSWSDHIVLDLSKIPMNLNEL